MATQQTQIVMPPHVNGTNRLFGGQLMVWIDIVAAVEARRHAQAEVTTVAVDSLMFLAPVKLNELVVLDAHVTWTGRTSMEVRVDSYVEQMDGTRTLVNVAYLVYVALADGKPKQVKPFNPETEEEKAEHAAAGARRGLRMIRYKMRT